jgi:hypothetical protein
MGVKQSFEQLMLFSVALNLVIQIMELCILYVYVFRFQ